MFTAHDVDCVTEEGTLCEVCHFSPAKVSIAGANLCAADADQVFPGWKEFVPEPPPRNTLVGEPEFALGKAPNVPMLGF